MQCLYFFSSFLSCYCIVTLKLHSVAEDSSTTQEATNNRSISQECSSSTVMQKQLDFDDIVEIAEAYDEAMDQHDWNDLKKCVDNPVLVISTDTGGQADLLEIMPRFMLGEPSLNLIFTNLSNSLTEIYQDYSTDQFGTSGEKKCSGRTVIDVLFQALASVQCLGKSQSSSSDTRALFVGSFRDKVTDEDFKSIDTCLHCSIEKTYFDHLVEFFCEDQIIWPVNNYSGSKKEMDKFKRRFLELMERYFEEVPIQAHWLMLNIAIQGEQTPLVSYQKCKLLASKLLIEKDELEKALIFLHKFIGTVLYYPQLRFFKDNIVRDTKVSFFTFKS